MEKYGLAAKLNDITSVLFDIRHLSWVEAWRSNSVFTSLRFYWLDREENSGFGLLELLGSVCWNDLAMGW